MSKKLKREKAIIKLIAPHGGKITCDSDMVHQVDVAIANRESVVFKAVFFSGEEKSVKSLMKSGKYIKFINEKLKH